MTVTDLTAARAASLRESASVHYRLADDLRDEAIEHDRLGLADDLAAMAIEGLA